MYLISRLHIPKSSIKRESDPLDTGRQVNVQKTFRRCPRRLLNVLGTFKLHYVSRREIANMILPKLVFSYMKYNCCEWIIQKSYWNLILKAVNENKQMVYITHLKWSIRQSLKVFWNRWKRWLFEVNKTATLHLKKIWYFLRYWWNSELLKR